MAPSAARADDASRAFEVAHLASAGASLHSSLSVRNSVRRPTLELRKGVAVNVGPFRTVCLNRGLRKAVAVTSDSFRTVSVLECSLHPHTMVDTKWLVLQYFSSLRFTRMDGRGRDPALSRL